MTETAASAKHPIRPEDLLRLAIITDAQISPDGRRVAYVVRHANLDPNAYTSAIYLIDTDTSGGLPTPQQFTSGTHQDTAPRWSPDGSKLAFVSDRSGKSQLYLLDMERGGEPWQVTSLARGASSPVWSPDSTRIAFLTSEGHGIDDDARDQLGGLIRHITRPQYRFDGLGYIDDHFLHVWVAPVDGGEPWQVTRGEQDDVMPAWSPDGSRIAFVSNREDGIQVTFRSQVYVVAASGEGEPVRVSRGTRMAAHPAWSPDGTQIAYIGLREDAPGGANNGVYLAPAAGDGDVPNLTAAFDRSPGVGLFSDTWNTGEPVLFWVPEGDALCFTAADQGRLSLFRVALNGEVSTVLSRDRAVGFVSRSSAGDRLAFVAGDFTNPCDLYVSDGGGGDEVRLTAVNEAPLAELPVQQPEHLPFESYDGGFAVDAWLIRPANYEPGKRYPLVQIIHGGPHSVFGHTFFFDMQLWASEGWNVLFVNPRATQGYGEAFATANLGRWGEGDWPEQEQALDLAIDRGGVDPDRLAVTGLSYGGFMTNWIIGHTNRYRVAVSENSISNLVSFCGTADIGWYWTDYELEPNIWENLDYYMRLSPISYVTQVRAPTLLLQSETDWRCPIEQGEQFYAALLAHGVPCEMVRLPGESHVVLRDGKPQSRLQRREHTLRWFHRYL